MRHLGQRIGLVLGVLVGLGLVVTGCGSTTSSGSRPSPVHKARQAAVPLQFEPNRGQSDARVTHISRGSDHTLLITRRGAVLKLRGSGREAVVRMTFVGAHRAPRVAGRGRLASVSNYLRGRDPSRWITSVPNFSRVVYSDLYDGVDLTFHASRAGELEFDYTLDPGVDPDAIRLAYSGADALRVDASGALVLRAGGGEIRQAPPIVYQTRNGIRRQVHASYELHGANEVGFAGERLRPPRRTADRPGAHILDLLRRLAGRVPHLERHRPHGQLLRRRRHLVAGLPHHEQRLSDAVPRERRRLRVEAQPGRLGACLVHLHRR